MSALELPPASVAESTPNPGLLRRFLGRFATAGSLKEIYISPREAQLAELAAQGIPVPGDAPPTPAMQVRSDKLQQIHDINDYPSYL